MSALTRTLGAVLLLSTILCFFPAVEGKRSESRLEYLRRASERHLVVLKDSAQDHDHARLLNKITVASPKLGVQAIRRHIKFGGFSAFALHSAFDASTLKLIAQDPAVHFIESDGIVRASKLNDDMCVKQTKATWGLNRVSEREPLMDGNFIHQESYGANVTVYVVDTGIYTQHDEFEGRAVWGVNMITHEPEDKDGNGHGTHCSGTIGGKTYGIARSAKLVAVRVLDTEGEGTNEEVIGGIEWLVRDAAANPGPHVASLSLGGGKNKALDLAVEKAIQAGITFIVAAGNDNADSCSYSPANVAPAVTVGATELAKSSNGTESDKRAYYSNYGSCVDVFAPGSYITSSWIGSPTATKTISGTSMATPHVAGTAAAYLSANPTAKPADVKTWLTSQSTKDLIDLSCSSFSSSSCKKSPNKILYIACGDEALQRKTRPAKGVLSDFDGAVAHDIAMEAMKDPSARGQTLWDSFKCQACTWGAGKLQREAVCKPNGVLDSCGNYIFSGLCNLVSQIICQDNCAGRDCAQVLCQDLSFCPRQQTANRVLYPSTISLFVQAFKFIAIIVLYICYLHSIRHNRLQLFYWVMGLGTAFLCPIAGAFRFIDMDGFLSLQRVTEVHEALAFLAATVGFYFVGSGIITSMILDPDTLYRSHRALWFGASVMTCSWVWAMFTGETRPVDTCVMIILVGVLAAIVWNFERMPAIANRSFLGMLLISISLVVRERAPNTQYISSTDVYELLIVAGYSILAKVPMLAHQRDLLLAKTKIC